MKRRLRRFAALQAARAADGWRVMATERKMKISYGHTLVAGRCDRIDFNDRTGEWCVVDYKTWDSAARAAAFETKKDGTRVWKSLQLPLYCAMLDADPDFPEAKRERITASYCILAKTAADTCYSESFSGADVPDAEAKVKELVDGIERGVFWPAADTGISPTGSSTLQRKASTQHGSPTSSAGLKLVPGPDASYGSVLGLRRLFVRRLG